MTPREKAKELIENFSIEIGQSDFHIPKFINGIDCANCSDEYGEFLEDETNLLAKNNALLCVNELLNDTRNPLVYEAQSEWYLFWDKVLIEIETF